MLNRPDKSFSTATQKLCSLLDPAPPPNGIAVGERVIGEMCIICSCSSGQQDLKLLTRDSQAGVFARQRAPLSIAGSGSRHPLLAELLPDSFAARLRDCHDQVRRHRRSDHRHHVRAERCRRCFAAQLRSQVHRGYRHMRRDCRADPPQHHHPTACQCPCSPAAHQLRQNTYR